MPVDDDSLRDVEAEAGAADVLGGEKRFEGTGGNVRRHAGAGIADLDHRTITVRAGGDAQSSRTTHRIDGVVDQVGPDLVQLTGIGLDVRHVGPVLPDHLDPAQPVASDDEGALDAVTQVDPLDRAPVHLGIGPDGSDEIGDSPGRFLDLGQQRGRGECARHPLERVLQGSAVEHCGHPLAPGDVHTGRGQRLGNRPVPFDSLARQPQ